MNKKSKKKFKKLDSREKAVKQFLSRLLVFIVIYIVIISTHGEITAVLYDYHPSTNNAYAGYLIFPFLALIAYNFKNNTKLRPYSNSAIQSWFFSILGLLILFLPLQNRLFLLTDHLIVSYFTPMVLGLFSIFLAVFNTKFIKDFKFEVSIAALAIVSFLSLQIFVDNYWMPLSAVIVEFLKYVLPLFSDSVYINGINVKIEGFNVNIGAPCAGFYSLVSFVFLYFSALLYVGRYKKLIYPRVILALFVGLLGLYLFNIIRVTIIILVGAFYSPELAINFFHEYLSAIFLLALLVVYLYFVIPKLIKK